MQYNFENLIEMFEKLFWGENKKGYSMYLALTIRNSEDMRKSFGIVVEPEQIGEGKSINDYEIYFMAGDYYLIPNSATLRKFDLISINHIDFINKNYSPRDKRMNLDYFYDLLKEFVKNRFSIDLRVKEELKLTHKEDFPEH